MKTKSILLQSIVCQLSESANLRREQMNRLRRVRNIEQIIFFSSVFIMKSKHLL